MNDKPDIWNGVEHVPDEPKEKEKASTGTVVAGILVALFMLIVALGLLNMFCYWAFNWRVEF